MDDSVYDIPFEIKSELDAIIAKKFKLFDFKSNHMMSATHVGTLLRILGCVPLESEIQDIISKTEFYQKKGVIHLANFLKHVKPLLQNKEMMSLKMEQLLDLFILLDPKNRGYIPKDEFVTLMKEYGEQLSDEELSTMLTSAIFDSDTNHVNFEMYARKLAYSPAEQNSIHKIAEMYIEPKPKRKLK